jgi:hypothetical protein
VARIEVGEGTGHETLARELYDLLIRPAEAIIQPSKRVLISPDGRAVRSFLRAYLAVLAQELSR